MAVLDQLYSYLPFGSSPSVVDLNNKFVLITGASSGIGLGFCHILLKNYPHVKLVVVDLVKPDFQCTFIKCDLSKSAEVKKVFLDISDKHGIPDVFILNAGVQHSVSLEDVSDEQYERIINVNFKNSYYAVKPFLAGFKSRKSGHLIFTCSVCSFISAPNAVPYCASKAAQYSFAGGLRSELNDFNVQVSTLTPGHIKTAMFKDYKVKYDWLTPSMTPDYVSHAIFNITQKQSSQQWMQPMFTILGPLSMLFPPRMYLYLQRLTGADVAIQVAPKIVEAK
eukprot:NODE_9_length_47730_cov_0.323718.p18 type:complete len:280 gc:universal NODE_9_length_47730_cov_0.323718:33674-34513(+)